MASTPESKVKKAVVDILKSYKAYYFFPVTGGFGRSGIPDIIACYRGHFIAIECKAEGKSPTELQKRELQKVKDSGGYALVVVGVGGTVKLRNLLSTLSWP